MLLTQKAAPAVLAGVLILLPVLAGCQSGAPAMTKKDEANFKGGPMPENARRIMQQKLQEARNKNPRTPAPGAPR